MTVVNATIEQPEDTDEPEASKKWDEEILFLNRVIRDLKDMPAEMRARIMAYLNSRRLPISM